MTTDQQDIHAHRRVLAAIPGPRMARLTALSNTPGLLRLAVHLGAMALTGAAILNFDGALRLLAQFIHGVLLSFLFAAAHESIHRTAFRTRRVNDIVAHGAGFLLLLPANAFRYFHFAHHRHTQDPARDPELAAPKPQTKGAYLWRLTGWSYWRTQAGALLSAASGRPLPAHVPPRGAAKLRREARIYLLGYAVIAAASLLSGSAVALSLWVLPALLGQPVLRAYLLAEHTACPLVPDMLRNTRTTFTNRLVRWLAWEMPHHTAHHAAPNTPFHRLPELNALIESELRATASGYVDAHCQILRAMGSGVREIS